MSGTLVAVGTVEKPFCRCLMFECIGTSGCQVSRIDGSRNVESRIAETGKEWPFKLNNIINECEACCIRPVKGS